jgi:hypothetical protein
MRSRQRKIVNPWQFSYSALADMLKASELIYVENTIPQLY